LLANWMTYASITDVTVTSHSTQRVRDRSVRQPVCLTASVRLSRWTRWASVSPGTMRANGQSVKRRRQRWRWRRRRRRGTTGIRQWHQRTIRYVTLPHYRVTWIDMFDRARAPADDVISMCVGAHEMMTLLRRMHCTVHNIYCFLRLRQY